MIEPLTAEDAALLYAEAPGTQLQIGALCFFEAAPFRDSRGRLRLAALRSHVEARLGALPRFRQRIAPVLGDVAAPMWVDDTDFAIERHCKLVELPAPGGPGALREFMDRLLGEPMDLAHPLWDIHLVEGIDDGTTGGVRGRRDGRGRRPCPSRHGRRHRAPRGGHAAARSGPPAGPDRSRTAGHPSRHQGSSI